MLLAASTTRYRLSRSDVARQRSLRRILRCDAIARKLFGETPSTRERRREPRHEIQVPINLRPAHTRGLSIHAAGDAPPFLALTSNISLGGLGFIHDEPFTAPTFLAEFDVAEAEPLILLVELRWTTEVQRFSYRSGGRIIGIARPA